MNQHWEDLAQLVEKKERNLHAAHQVQRFVRAADETKSWMNEKDTALLSDDYGRDLASVQALQRKHEGLERDLAALEDKVRLFLPPFSLNSVMFSVWCDISRWIC